MGFPPTEEQRAALDVFKSGSDFVIEAGAGTGKTQTLLMLVRANQTKQFQMTAFNKAIVEDVKKELPRNGSASTMHALANQGTGRKFSHRYQGARVSGTQLARRLNIGPLLIYVGDHKKMLQPDWLASLCSKTVQRYCQTADPEPLDRHVPYIDGIDDPDLDRWANQTIVREHIRPAVRRMVRELFDTSSDFPFSANLGFAGCVKSWQLFGAGDPANPKRPHIAADVVLLDEAQDTAPVMADVFAQQTHAQRVMVGDAAQSINEFMGAIDAMEAFEGVRTKLSGSFRFGPAIADVANLLLDQLPYPLRLTGMGPAGSVIDHLDIPSCVLTRTNAKAIETVLTYQREGHTTHLVGGADQIASFCRAARELQEGRSTRHHELSIFQSWGEVVEYTRSDPSGDELRLLVNLIEEFGTETILAAVDNTIPEKQADVVVSTAHKSKGRAWPTVQIAADFSDEIEADAEWKLLYVAATRAREVLDIHQCNPIVQLNEGATKPKTRLEAEECGATPTPPGESPRQLSIAEVI